MGASGHSSFFSSGFLATDGAFLVQWRKAFRAKAQRALVEQFRVASAAGRLAPGAFATRRPEDLEPKQAPGFVELIFQQRSTAVKDRQLASR